MASLPTSHACPDLIPFADNTNNNKLSWRCISIKKTKSTNQLFCPPPFVPHPRTVCLSGDALLPTTMADEEHFSLCWNNFNANLSTGFHDSLCRGDLVDVTLVAEGQMVKAHRLVLSVCSPLFREMFAAMTPNQQAFGECWLLFSSFFLMAPYNSSSSLSLSFPQSSCQTSRTRPSRTSSPSSTAAR